MSLARIGFKGELSIMRSNGGVMTPAVATSRPVAMMESGPVGGIIASARFGCSLGQANVISFDMGGTTAKASLVKDGEPTLAPGYYVGGYASGHPVMLPMIDVVEVGAGGGSIAWLDEIGALKVGPTSAGASPGPICYRGGGTEPTITDANVVLGRLDPDNFLGGTMKLDAEGARAGVERVIAKPLGMDTIAAAKAIVDIAVSKMSLAVREVSVEKGYDPRDFALVASGGAGPLHVMAIARELHIPTVIVPLFPSHFSALGMLLADERHDFVRTFYADLSRLDFARLRAVHEEMAAEALGSLRHKDAATLETQLDIRYVGQEFTLSVPVDRGCARSRRPRRHPQGLRCALRAPVPALLAGRAGRGRERTCGRCRASCAARVSRRSQLWIGVARAARGPSISTASPSRSSAPSTSATSCRRALRSDGPAIVQEHGTTTVMFAGDRCTVAPTGELIITVGGAG